MKKIYILASALLAVTTLKAQFTTIDFEELPLPSEQSYWNGADESGHFLSQNVRFDNFYEVTDWGYNWHGFAYSNMSDTTTPGFENQYSAFAGMGAENTEKYGIFYYSSFSPAPDTLAFPSQVQFNTVAVTNTTYAGISMRDGNEFSKQFGSPNGANGAPDGTEGKDFFYVTFYGWDANSNLVDSTEIYLADFRSDNATDHYILQEWTTFDLSKLNGSMYLTFNFTSSDVGEWGINTPTYFALDNLEYAEMVNNTSEHEFITAVYPNPTTENIHVKGSNGTVRLLDLNGQILDEVTHLGHSTLDVSSYPRGMYIVQLSTSNGVAAEKIIIQ